MLKYPIATLGFLKTTHATTIQIFTIHDPIAISRGCHKSWKTHFYPYHNNRNRFLLLLYPSVYVLIT